MQFNLSKAQAERIIRVLHSTDDPVRDEALADMIELQAACGPSRVRDAVMTLNELDALDCDADPDSDHENADHEPHWLD